MVTEEYLNACIRLAIIIGMAWTLLLVLLAYIAYRIISRNKLLITHNGKSVEIDADSVVVTLATKDGDIVEKRTI